MKIEPTPIATASLLAADAERATPCADAMPEETVLPQQMSYEDLLPYLLLPMAGAY